MVLQNSVQTEEIILIFFIPIKKIFQKGPLFIAILECCFSLPVYAGDDIVLGQSAAFTGTSAGLGAELWVGAQVYFDEVNAKGGISGHKIRVISLDDHYSGDLSLPNTLELIKANVFALFGYVGTPTLVKALPVIQKYGRENKMFLFSNFTGAQPQRQEPYKPYVFNVRTSYAEELEEIINNLYTIGKRRFGLFIQDDAYGRSGASGATRALIKHGLSPVLEVTYHRGANASESMSEQAELLKKAGVDAIISVSAYAACAAFIRDLRRAGVDVPITNVSFVGSIALLNTLLQMKDEKNVDLTQRLIISQVVPFYKDTDVPLVREYLESMDRFTPALPDILKDDKYKMEKYSFSSLEGYLNAKVFSEILRRIKGPITRESFIKTAESLSTLDVGLPEKVGFSKDRHQALHRVYFTTIHEKKFVPLRHWEQFK